MKWRVLYLLIAVVHGSAYAVGDPEIGRVKAVACQACHGPGGRSENTLYPVLAGQHAEYIVRQLKAFRSGTRKNPIMNGMAAPLTESDMEHLGAFFARNRAKDGGLSSGVE